MRLRSTVLALATATVAPVVLISPAAASTLPPGTAAARTVESSCPAGAYPDSGFTDVAGNTHEKAIDCLVWWKVASGRSTTSYAPAAGVTREAMASFIARAIGAEHLAASPPDAFSDDNGSVHELAINQLAAAGIVSGTGNGAYSPARMVTRGQMSRFIAGAAAHLLGGELPATRDFFDDDEGHLFEEYINRIGEAGITTGQGAREYAPDSTVNRDQMASFLARLLDLLVERGVRSTPEPTTPPPPPPGPTVVAEWNLDDTGTTMSDSSGNNLHGELTNVVVGQPGVAGTAYGFESTPAYATVPTSTDLNPEAGDFSVTASIRFASIPAGGPDQDSYEILRKGFVDTTGGYWKLEILETGQAHCLFLGAEGEGDVTGTANLADDAWHTLTCARSGSTVTLVVDGESRSDTGPTGAISNTSPVRIGAKNTLGHDQFRGFLDEVSITKG